MYAITARRADPTTRPSLQLYAMFMANKPPDDIRVAAGDNSRNPRDGYRPGLSPRKPQIKLTLADQRYHVLSKGDYRVRVEEV
jgi:hypothetical protein